MHRVASWKPHILTSPSREATLFSAVDMSETITNALRGRKARKIARLEAEKEKLEGNLVTAQREIQRH